MNAGNHFFVEEHERGFLSTLAQVIAIILPVLTSYARIFGLVKIKFVIETSMLLHIYR